MVSRSTCVTKGRAIYKIDSTGAVSTLQLAPIASGDYVDLVVVGDHLYSVHQGLGEIHQTDLTTGITTTFRTGLDNPASITAIERQIVP